MKTIVHLPALAIFTVFLSACATFDEPVTDDESAGLPDSTDEPQRLLIPGVTTSSDVENQPPLLPSPSSSEGSTRLTIPTVDPQDTPSDEGVAVADNDTGAAIEAIAATEPAEVEDIKADPLKPHHRTDNIDVVTWRAERGHTPSQLLMGRAYARGDGIEKNMQQARLWLELAALQGNNNAQFELGLMYFIGAGIERDYGNAREWWLESAISGNDKAQQRLGYMYSEGLGVERDFNRARDWYMKSANLGNAEAQTLLGSLYHEGNRIEPDYPQAYKWYQLAAEQGHPYAQYALGILHHDGLGTEQDFIKCAAWVDVALANQYPDELGARDLCRANLDEQSKAAADALASLWKTQYRRR